MLFKENQTILNMTLTKFEKKCYKVCHFRAQYFLI